MAQPERVSSQFPLRDLSALAQTSYRNIDPILKGNFQTEFVAGGTRSLGFKVALPDEDLPIFLKVYINTPIPRKDLTGLISRSDNNHQFSFEELALMRREVDPTEIFHMGLMHQVEQQAAAHVVGNQCQPNLVVPLHALWVYGQTPVGYSIEFIEGKPITTAKALEKGGQFLINAISRLSEVGVTIDRSLNQANAIKKPGGKIQLFDLDYELPNL